MHTKHYKLLIFDWDGTIMDSTARIVSCLQTAQAAVNMPVKSSDENKKIIGLGLRTALEVLYPEASSAQITMMAQAYSNQFLNQNNTPSPLFEGMYKLLTDMHNRPIDLAIATGKSRRGLDLVLGESKTGLQPLFTVTKTADETLSKPHPLMLEQILTEVQIDCNDAVMIGDSSFDLEMAQAIGMDSVAVTYGAQSAEDLQGYKTRATLHTVATLHDWLRAHTPPKA